MPTPEIVEETKALLGLDKPIITQYFIWLNDAIRLDFGNHI